MRERGVARRLSRQPGDPQPLVGARERVERVRDPDPSACEDDLLGEHRVGDHGGAPGVRHRTVDEAGGTGRVQGAAGDTEHDEQPAYAEHERNDAAPPQIAPREPGSRERRGEQHDPDGAARRPRGEHDQTGERDQLPQPGTRTRDRPHGERETDERRDVGARRERERRPQADALPGGLTAEDAGVVRRRVPEGRRRTERDERCDEHAAGDERLTARTVEQQVRARDGETRQRRPVQVRPEAEQRRDEPDEAGRPARLGAQHDDERREQREREELCADRDDRTERRRDHHDQHEHGRAVPGAEPARVECDQAARDGDGRDLRDLQPAGAGKRVERSEHQLGECGHVRPAMRRRARERHAVGNASARGDRVSERGEPARVRCHRGDDRGERGDAGDAHPCDRRGTGRRPLTARRRPLDDGFGHGKRARRLAGRPGVGRDRHEVATEAHSLPIGGTHPLREGTVPSLHISTQPPVR